ncbi:rhodanese-like domain-containing protein [Euzebya sp.]|uniref:rhodanese-like domain-containing protein n=1 Tax=Euzebya sp. TaxID=1971409 RepID=UPI003517C95B
MTSYFADRYFADRLAHETDCADLHARLGEPGLVVVDARSRADHTARRIPGAISLPHREITAEALNAFDDRTEFATYCWGPHCNGATKAAAAIAALGRPVREVLGGVWGWAQEGYAFEGTDVDAAAAPAQVSGVSGDPSGRRVSRRTSG